MRTDSCPGALMKTRFPFYAFTGFSKSNEKPMVLLSFQKVGKTPRFSLLFEGVPFACMFSLKVMVLFQQNAYSRNLSRQARAKRTQGHASKACKNICFLMVFDQT